MIYLNNAATSYPKPQEVIEAVNKCLGACPVNSSRSGLDHDDEDIIYSTRRTVADFFNIDNPNQVVFTSGSTESLNFAIKGIDLKGKHVVSTMIEHNSVVRPLNTLKRDGEIDVTFAECDNTGYVRPEDIEAAIRPDTKAVVVNHCSNVTGTFIDIKTISEIAHKHGCTFIVDASQSAGALPIDVKDMDIDLLALTGHKSLYGLPGSGALYIKEGLPIRPLKTGGTGVLSEVLVQPNEMPLYGEAGTPNTPGIVSLKAGIEWIKKTGMENIHARKKAHMEKIYSELGDMPAVTIYRSMEHNSYANFCFNVGKMVPEEINYLLESSYDIAVRSGLHCAPLILKPLGVEPWGTVRASVSYFTTEAEVDTFIDSIKDIVKTFVK